MVEDFKFKSLLVVRAAEKSDFGYYECEVKNSYGKTKMSVLAEMKGIIVIVVVL